ncbi:hypothetical protein SAMD00019534_027240 [Acytostelium subglobosum LB1]|uniref:hypothetical protein n=1 Tax=Acytostelium subglobosum LB1 TaxID=1410327 RepID=UPI000644D766|nr:hypothetical protein SAMD00019534_027240 [Acytostelium subglobosum LB1]GAM19549.1 hypothetical protein SAMD00019534_027240 [Acytostelium subglobosum LB1]|eukprot:XP_012757476.1 hypothetical protein SAMD00019534_027240 [Acytostelium subglobosum LB1]
MFESIVTDIIAKYIGEYIKNLSSEQLKVNIFSGNVILRNLEIKGEALQSFKLPLHVQKGIIGTLELKIPWTNLKSMPVILEIDSICLYAIPQTGFEYNEQEERRKMQEDKQKKLDKYELVRSWKEGGQGASDAPSAQQQDTFMSNVMSKILNNIEIKINTFHLRYEEVRNGKVYSLGMSFGSLSAYSTDGKFARRKFHEGGAISNETVYKFVELSDFSIYLNSDDTSVSTLSNDEMQRYLKSRTGSSGVALGEHRYILKPITVTLRIEINKNLSMDTAVPKMKIQCQFEEVSFYLEENQYQTILKLLSTINSYTQELKYLKYRPKLRPKQDPKAWWRYCAQVYRESIRERIQQRSWSFIQKRRQNRKEYVSLFKKLQGVEWIDPITEKETKRLQEMEESLSFEDIVYFRSLARRELAKEQAIADSKKGEFYSSVNRTRFFGFWNKANEPKMSIQLTKEQQDEIYKSIEYDEIALGATIEMPPEYIQNILEVKVEAIVFTVIGGRKGEGNLLKSYLNNITFKMSQRAQGVRLDLDLESFNVIDHFNADSLFPYVITSSPRFKNNRSISGNNSPIKDNKDNNNINKHEHLFNIVMETNPISSTYDYRLSLQLNMLEIIVNKTQIERLIDFATPKDNVNLFSLSSVAMEELIMLKEMTIFQMWDAVNHHKTIDLHVDAKAPTVIIPEHFNRQDTSLLVIDLGNCLMYSDVSQKTVKTKKTAPRPDLGAPLLQQLASSGDQSELENGLKESDLYDYYRVELSSIRVLLARNDQEWWRVPSGPSGERGVPFPLVEEMAISMNIQNCIEPNELSLAIFKVSGTLPEVKINISDATYLQLYQMARTLTTESSHTTHAYNQLMDTLSSSRPSETFVDVSQMEIKLSDAYRQVLVRRKLFDGDFTLQRVLVDVYSSRTTIGAQTTTRQLIQLRVHELQLQVKKRTYDYSGSLLLGKMEIDDCLEQHSRFSHLVTSQSRLEDQVTKDLISITIGMIEKQSPEYTGVDVFVDFNFGELNINYNPKSIGHVMTYLDYCLEETYRLQEEMLENGLSPNIPIATSPSPSPTKAPLASSSTTSLLAQSSGTMVNNNSSNNSASSGLSVIQAKATVHSLSISLNDEGVEIGMFSINRFMVKECTVNGREFDIEGHLDSITVESFVDQCADGQSFKMLTPKNLDVSMATFKYRSFNGHRGATVKRDFDSEVTLNLRSIHVTVLVDFILRTKHLIQLPFKTLKYATIYSNTNNSNLAEDNVDSGTVATPQRPSIISKVSKTNYTIQLESPQIVLLSSDHLATSDDRIISELGSIEISTVLKRCVEPGVGEEVEWEVIQATLRDMNIKTLRAGRHHQVLHDLSIGATIETMLCSTKTQLPIPSSVVAVQKRTHIDIKEIALQFEDLEHSLIVGVVKDVLEKVSSSSQQQSQRKLNASSGTALKKPLQVDDRAHQISVDLQQFTLLLQLDEHHDFGQIALNKFNVRSESNSLSTSTFIGSLQSLTLRDMRPDAKGTRMFETVLAPLASNDAQLSFKFTTFNDPSQSPMDGWNSCLALDMSPTCITASAGFLLGLKDFFLLPFTSRLTDEMRAHPMSFNIPLLADIQTPSRMKLDINVRQPKVLLPVSPFSSDHIMMSLDHISITNSFVDWSIGEHETTFPVESIVIHIADVTLSAQVGTETTLTRQPFDIKIDYQAIQASFVNTLEVLARQAQPTTVGLMVSPLVLDMDESNYIQFTDMVAQVFRSLDDVPPLKLRSANPGMLDLIMLQATPDVVAKLPDIFGMRINVTLEQIKLELRSHLEHSDPFANVWIHDVQLAVDMATVPRPKKMYVKGSVQQLEVFDRRIHFNHDAINHNDRAFCCRDPMIKMMEFTYLSLDPKSAAAKDHTSDLVFNMNGLLTQAYPAFLLRVWDSVAISLTSVFGTYSTDKYRPANAIHLSPVKPVADSRMRMNVRFDRPLIKLCQGYQHQDHCQMFLEPDHIILINKFTELSKAEAVQRGSTHSTSMHIHIDDVSITLVDHTKDNRARIASSLNLDVTMEGGSGEPQHFSILTNALRLSLDQHQFSSLYNCTNHALECHYQLAHQSQAGFLRPGPTPKQTDMFVNLEMESFTMELIDTVTAATPFATLSLQHLNVDTSMLGTGGMVVNGSLADFTLQDIRDAQPTRFIVAQHGAQPSSVSFAYKSHKERNADGWDSEVEATVKHFELSPFPLDILLAVKSFLLNPVTANPIAQSPSSKGGDDNHMRLALVCQHSRALLSSPSIPNDHVVISVDSLEMHNMLINDASYELERWIYDVASLCVDIERLGMRTKLLTDLDLRANTDTIKHYDQFLSSLNDQHTAPPHSKTQLALKDLNISLSQSNYQFLHQLYTSFASPAQPTTSTTATTATETRSYAYVISTKISTFQLLLIDGHNHRLATVSLDGLESNVVLSDAPGDGEVQVIGSLHTLRLEDSRHEMSRSRFPTIFGINKQVQPGISFKYQQLGQSKRASVDIENANIVPIFDLFTAIQQYFQPTSSDMVVAHDAPKTSMLQYTMTLKSSNIVMPYSNYELPEHLSCHVGLVTINNGDDELAHDIDQILMRIWSMSITPRSFHGEIGPKILMDMDVDINMQSLVHNQSQLLDKPITSITVNVGTIKMALDAQQYLFLYNTLNANLKRYYEFKHGPYPLQPLVAQPLPQQDNDVDAVQLDMRVVFNIQSLAMEMCFAHFSPTFLTLNQLSMDIDMTSRKMVVQGTANDLIISNGNPYNCVHNQLLTKDNQQQDVFVFTFILHAATQPVDYDSEFEMELRSIQLVSMLGALIRVKDFLMEPLSVPVVSPPNALTRGRPSRMKQTINMAPWTLLIPATDSSHDAVLINFGTTHISNLYRDCCISGDIVQPVEVMQIVISQLSLFTSRDGIKRAISNSIECSIDIEKLFTVHEVLCEDQRMAVSIPKLELILNQDDYRFFYFVFTSDWMRFGAPNDRPVVVPPPFAPPLPQLLNHRFVYIPPEHSEQMRVSENQFSSPLGFVHIANDSPRRMKVSCEIGRLSMAVSHTDSNVDPIASLEINQVSVNYHQLRNNDNKIEMMVRSVQLVDERTDAPSVFKEILTRKTRANQGPPHLYIESLIDAQKNRNYVSINCDHPLLFVSPDSILPIMEFFTSIKNPLTKYQVAPPQPSTRPDNHFRFYLKVIKPKLLLVENETQQNTRALVVKMPIEFHYSFTPEKNLTMELKASRCQVFRTTPFSDTEGISSTPLTNSFAFDFIFIHFAENDQRTINIRFQALNIFLSYKDMMLINRIFSNLSLPPGTAPGGASAPLPASAPNSQQSKSLNSPIRPEDSFKLMHKTRIKLDFVGRVNLTLLDEAQSVTLQDIPFLQLTMGDLSSNFWGWSDYSFTTTSCMLKVEVFNHKHMAFDSLVEQFPLTVQLLSADDPKTKISIRTEDLVNINLSHPFISSLARFYENIQITNDKENRQQHQQQQQQQQEQQEQLQRCSSNINIVVDDTSEHSSDSSTPSSYEPKSSSPSLKPFTPPLRHSFSPIGSYSSLRDLEAAASSSSPSVVPWKSRDSPSLMSSLEDPKQTLSASIIAHTKRDSTKSSVILTHFHNKHRRTMSNSINSQQLFNTVGQNLIWIVNLTGKDIQFYVEELQLIQPASAQEPGMRRNDGSWGSNMKLSPSASSASMAPDAVDSDDEDDLSSSARTKINRQVYHLKNREKRPIELSSVLFKSRDFRTLGSLNAHIALKFTDSDKDEQWISGVSINMIGDNYYFPPSNQGTNIIVCEVGWNESNENKIATLRSPIIVRNSTTVPIDILILSGKQDRHVFGPVAVDDNFYIPVEYFNYNSFITIRPSDIDLSFDMDNALDLVDSSSWPASHLFSPFKVASAPVASTSNLNNSNNPNNNNHSSNNIGSSPGINRSQSISRALPLDRFHLALLSQPGIRCEKTGLISNTLVICPPLIIENSLYCDIEIRIHNHSEVKRGSRTDYNRSLQQRPPTFLLSGKQTPFYTQCRDDVGMTLCLRGVGKEVYFHLYYMLEGTGSGSGFIQRTPMASDNEGSGTSFTQDLSYQCLDNGYTMQLKVDHRFEGGCHIATIYTTNAVSNHTMIPFVLRPSIPGLKSAPHVTLQSNETPIMLSHDKFTLSHPSFPEITSKEFDIILGKEDIIEIQLHGRDTMKLQFRVFVNISNASKVFFRTRIVDIYPRFCLVNRLPLTLSYTQFSRDMVKMASDSLELAPDAQIPFHWFNGMSEQLIAVTMSSSESAHWGWSSGARIDMVGTHYIKLLHSQDSSIEQIIKVDVVDTNESIMVVFHPADPISLPFHLKNDTNVSMTFVQKAPGSKRYQLLPNDHIYFTWDHPTAEQKILVYLDSNPNAVEINLNKIKNFKTIKYNGQVIYPVSQAVNGVTRELTFSYHHEEVKVVDLIEFAVELSFEKIGISIINDVPEELIYILLKDTSLWYSSSNITQTLWVTIDDIQIDNQKTDTDYPVLLYCEKKLNGKSLPFLEFSAIKLNKENFDYYDLIALYLNEIYVQIDDITLINLYSFYSKLPLDKFWSSSKGAAVANVEQPSMFYIKWLIIAEIQLYLTFSITRDGILSNYNKLPALRLLVPSLGKSLGQLENAPLKINSLGIKNVFTTQHNLQEHLYSHYNKQMKRQVSMTFNP